MKKIENETLKIKGLKNEYTFIHISDAHLSYTKEDAPEEEKEMCKEHTLEWSRNGKTPLEAFDDVVDYVNTEKPDALFMTGDCVDYASKNNSAYLKEQIEKMNTEVLYVYGNHESVNYADKTKDHKYYYPLYNDLMEGNPSYRLKDYGDLLVCVIDDADKKITKEQIDFLKEQIEKNLPIILLIHIPVSTDTLKEPVECKWGEGAMSYFALDGDNPIDTTVEFCELINAKDNNIAAVFAGHIHTPYKGKLKNGTTMYVAGTAYGGYARKIKVIPE